MKIILVSCLLALIIGCDDSPVIEGKYVKVGDNGRGSALNVFEINLIEEVNFGEEMCRFEYIGTTIAGKYTIDGNYVYIDAGGMIGMLSMEIVGVDTLEGEGWISGTFIKSRR